MCKNIILAKQLQEILSAHAFKKRGAAFFRIWGDGVLQVLKFEFERCFSHYVLYFGLFSMYSQLQKEWLTSCGCIPQYPIVTLAGRRSTVMLLEDESRGYPYLTVSISTLDEQLAILKSVGIEWLNNVTDQRKLVEARCGINVIEHGQVITNDIYKFAPYLASGNIDNAADTIRAILNQHRQGRSDESYYANKKLVTEDAALRDLLQMAEAADPVVIHEWLANNYSRNLQFAKFLLS